MGNEPMVLIARLDDGRTLYAVEREDRGLYVLCRLGSWVNLQQLKAASVASKQEVPKGQETAFGANSTPSQQVPVPTTTAQTHKYDRKKRLAIEAIQSMVKRPSTAISMDSQQINEESQPRESQMLESQDTESQLLDAPVESQIAEEPPVQPTSTEIIDNVRLQYLEALYLSKVCFPHDTSKCNANSSRRLWLILPKVLFLELAQLSILIMIPIWK